MRNRSQPDNLHTQPGHAGCRLLRSRLLTRGQKNPSNGRRPQSLRRRVTIIGANEVRRLPAEDRRCVTRLRGTPHDPQTSEWAAVGRRTRGQPSIASVGPSARLRDFHRNQYYNSAGLGRGPKPPLGERNYYAPPWEREPMERHLSGFGRGSEANAGVAQAGDPGFTGYPIRQSGLANRRRDNQRRRRRDPRPSK
jgi:hypothetical protein